MSEQIMRVPLDKLLPWDNAGRGQPRKHFDPAALQELADSMKTGFIGSITVRPFPGRPGYYEILAGHRRHKAAGLAGLAEIPCTVQDLSDDAARLYVLQDNLNREGFLAWEEGAGYAELVEGGMSIADVAAKVGKSPGFVAGRIAIHTGAGEKARAFYLRKDLTLAALELVATLPNRNLSPVKCPRCKVVACEGTMVCPSCAADLSAILRCEWGNPQDIAVGWLRGKTNGTVAEVVERVRESYGLSDKPVQASLGFDTVQISEEAIAVRTELERKLSDVSKAGDYFLQNAKKLEEYTPDQRRAVAAQCEAAVKWLQYIREAAVPSGPLALAL
jgi:ParB/RepB/Spo0J family partition protein